MITTADLAPRPDKRRRTDGAIVTPEPSSEQKTKYERLQRSVADRGMIDVADGTILLSPIPTPPMLDPEAEAVKKREEKEQAIKLWRRAVRDGHTRTTWPRPRKAPPRPTPGELSTIFKSIEIDGNF